MLYAILKNKNWGKEDASWVVTTHDAAHDESKMLEYCSEPRSRQEIMDYMGLANRKHFSEHYLAPLLESDRLVMTIPDKPKSKNQKHVKLYDNIIVSGLMRINGNIKKSIRWARQAEKTEKNADGAKISRRRDNAVCQKAISGTADSKEG